MAACIRERYAYPLRLHSYTDVTDNDLLYLESEMGPAYRPAGGMHYPLMGVGNWWGGGGRRITVSSVYEDYEGLYLADLSAGKAGNASLHRHVIYV